MTSLTCFVAVLLAVLSIPVFVLLWATESRSSSSNRLKKNGETWKAIGTRYGVSPTTARIVTSEEVE